GTRKRAQPRFKPGFRTSAPIVSGCKQKIIPFGLDRAFTGGMTTVSASVPPSPAALPVADREQMILEHMPQVRLIARKIHDRIPGIIALEDLVSAGTLGLIAAIDRYDASQNVKLRTYAEFKIRGAILDSLRELDWAPRTQRQ